MGPFLLNLQQQLSAWWISGDFGLTIGSRDHFRPEGQPRIRLWEAFPKGPRVKGQGVVQRAV